MRNSSFVVALLFVGSLALFSSVPVAGQPVCDLFNGSQHVPQEWDSNWCIFACQEFLAAEFGWGVDQCIFVESARWKHNPGGFDNYQIGLEDCCPQSYLCASYWINGGVVDNEMNRVGFGEWGGADVWWRNSLAVKSDLSQDLCGGHYVLSAHNIMGDRLGHAVVVFAYYEIADVAFIMNPNRFDTQIVTFQELISGSFEGSYGEQLARMRVGSFTPLLVGIEDVAGFWFHDEYFSINLQYRLASTADPDDSLAVYVADNPYGPARRIQTIKPIGSPPPSEGIVKNFSDWYRPYRWADYYYYLDHGYGNFSDIRDPLSNNYPVVHNEDNPIPRTEHMGGGARDTLGTPSISSLADAPLNFGNLIDVDWALSADDSVIDYYNVYRKTLDGTPGSDFVWLGSVQPGTGTYSDATVIAQESYSYMVSAAHQGISGDVSPHRSNVGLWNDFSPAVQGTAVNSFYRFDLELTCDSTLVVCPQGDGLYGNVDTLRVLGSLTGSDDSPTEGASAEMLRLYAVHDSAYFCEGDTSVAIGATDSTGATAFVIPHIGGHGVVDLISGFSNTYLLKDTVSVVIKSPDKDGDGYVSMVDYTVFGNSWLSTCDSTRYDEWFDFDDDCYIGLQDFSVFGAHWTHGCPVGGQAVAPALARSNGTIDVEFSEDVPLRGPRRLRAYVTLSDVEPYQAILLVFKNENPSLRFSRWVAESSYLKATMCTETIRDGQREVFVGAMGGMATTARTLGLGYIELDVLSAETFELSESDLELVDASLLGVDGGALGFSSSQTQRAIEPRVFTNELAQNYPNPFNPSTTIAFSVKEVGAVNLQVFDVAGRLIKTLVDDRRGPDNYRVHWDGRNNAGNSVASGIYFYRLIAGDFRATKKMVLLR